MGFAFTGKPRDIARIAAEVRCALMAKRRDFVKNVAGGISASHMGSKREVAGNAEAMVFASMGSSGRAARSAVEKEYANTGGGNIYVKSVCKRKIVEMAMMDIEFRLKFLCVKNIFFIVLCR